VPLKQVFEFTGRLCHRCGGPSWYRELRVSSRFDFIINLHEAAAVRGLETTEKETVDEKPLKVNET